MAIVGEQHGIFPRLKAFVQSGKPVRRGDRNHDQHLPTLPHNPTPYHNAQNRCGARARA